MRNTLEGSRYVYVNPNGESKMITFTHNRGNDECATQNGGWDNSYISQGFYDSSVKPKLNAGFNKDHSKTATFAKTNQENSEDGGGKCSNKNILLAIGVIVLLLAGLAVSYFIFGAGKN